MTALEHAIDALEQFKKSKKLPKWTKINDHPCSQCGEPVWHIGADCFRCMKCGLGFGGSV